MTAIKQKGVSHIRHGKNLKRYIDNDKALLRDTQNLINPMRWYEEMEMTREDFGHNKARASAKGTIIYHQMLNFLPDECDMNGGVMTPDLCMKYAKEYTATYYPDYQIVFALHKEHCKADDTYRYSVHMAINRSNLKTGNRLDERRGDIAKRKRATQVRALDEKWELSQLKKGVRNSMIHDKQPSRLEREIEAKGVFSYKANLRELMTLAKEESTSFEKWTEKMNEWGVDVSVENGRIYITDTDNSRYSFRSDRLNYKFAIDNLIADLSDTDHKLSAEVRKFKREIGNEVINSREVSVERDRYKADIEKRFVEYKKFAEDSQGTEYKDFPEFIVPNRTKVHDTLELNLLTVSLKQKADELRVKYADNVPASKGKRSIVGGDGSTDNSKSHNMNKQQKHDRDSVQRKDK